MSAQAWFSVGAYEVRADDLWIIATAVCCSVSCGLVGCFLVLRRLSLLGDAISHAILPGLALAFILTGSRDPWAMLLGAMAVGLLTAVLSSALHRWGRVSEDASMGVVFTTLFALGVVMVTIAARNIDLDPGCVLYGLIEFVPFDTMTIAGVEAPRALVWLGAVLLLNTALIVAFFKELRIVCFDPALATSMGISATLVHYGLMTSVAVTSVASFESVGSILVVAMLVAPGATAHLLTDRFGRMLWISSIVAALSAVLGYVGAVWLNTSVAGMIATTALGLFMLAVLLAPRHGVIAKRLRRLGLSVRICREDMLGLVYRWHEAADAAGVRGGAALPPVVASEALALSRAGLLGRAVLAWLVATGVVQRSGDGSLRLTNAGLGESRRIVRGHRLWETYLAKRAGVNPAKVHAPAHATEHFLSDDLRSQLDEELGEPHDPHGRVIP